MATSTEHMSPAHGMQAMSTGPVGRAELDLRSADLTQWLVDQRNSHTTPDEIATALVSNGWDADSAARTSLRSLRSSDRHTLTYAALNISAGLAALGFATSAHLIIRSNPSPQQLTWMLTLTLITAPIAFVSGYSATSAERSSRFVMWSPSRRGWFGALSVCTAVVGISRLITYIYGTLATLTGASSEPFSWASAGQVAVSVAVSLPLFIWSFTQWRRSNLVISALGQDV